MKGGRIVDAWTEGTAEQDIAAGPAVSHDRAPTDDRPIGDTFEHLVEASKELAEAELAWVKARAAYVTNAVAWIGGLGALAFALAFAMIVTLMVGAVFALAPHIGPGLALLVTCLAAGAIILACVLGMRRFVGRIARIVK
ncbi:MAG TPA: hypothetical protein VL918_14585 [Sphingobium sp.]|nr:hypothetical protein [Sphingobium sp.]